MQEDLKNRRCGKLGDSIANDNSHGYDQTNKQIQITIAPRYWFRRGKCRVPVKSNGATYTGNSGNIFELRFTDVTGQINLATGSGVQKRGYPSEHRKPYCNGNWNGQVVQASQNEFGGTTGGQTGDQTGEEIWTTGYYNYPWDCVLRYKSGEGVLPGDIYLVRWIPG